MRFLLPVAMLLVLCAPLGADDREKTAALIDQLDSKSYAEREAASAALRKLGARAADQLVAALKDASPEAGKRISELLANQGWLPPDERKRVDALMSQFLTGEPPRWSFKHYYWHKPLRKRLAAFNSLRGMGHAAQFHLRRALHSSPKARLEFKVTSTLKVVYPGQSYNLRAVLVNKGPGGVWLRRRMPRSSGSFKGIARRSILVGKPGKGGSGSFTISSSSGSPSIPPDPLHKYAYLPEGGEVRMWQAGLRCHSWRFGKSYWGVTFAQSAKTATVALADSRRNPIQLSLKLWTGKVVGSIRVDHVPQRVTGERGTPAGGLALSLSATEPVRPGEQMQMSLSLRNTLDAPLGLLDPRQPIGHPLLWYIITNTADGTVHRGGLVLPKTKHMSTVPADKLTPLAAGKSWSVPIPIAGVPAGKYEVRVGYGRVHKGEGKVVGLWTGEAVSNIVPIEVRAK